MRKKRTILKIGFICNLSIMIIMILIMLIGFFTNSTSIENFVFGMTVNIVQSIFGFILFSYWVYLLVLWSKHDKHIGRFFALFFLIGWYSIYYSHWLLRNRFLEIV